MTPGRELQLLLRSDRCSGCHQDVGPLCRSCRAALAQTRPAWVDRPERADQFPIACASAYAPPLSTCVIGYKDRDQWALRPYLAQLLVRSVAHLFTCLVRDGRDSMPALDLVPIASSRHAIRERDSDVIAELAGAAARILRSVGFDVVTSRILVLRGPHSDHVGLSRTQRWANVHDAFDVVGHPRTGADVVLIDDVVTTGATLDSANAALTRAGVVIKGAAVLAATHHVGAVSSCSKQTGSRPDTLEL